MKRGEPLKRKTPLKAGKGLRRKSKLAPISQKQKEKNAGERKERDARGAAFKRAIAGLNCVVCGRSDAEAFSETGHGHQAHHGLRQQTLRRLGLPLWDPELAVCVCEEPCHRQHTSRKRRILRRELPYAFLLWAAKHDAMGEVLKEYPS